MTYRRGIAPIIALALLASGIPLSGLVTAGIAGWFAYKAWKRRKPRQRKPVR